MRQWRILHTESSRGWGGQEVRVFAELLWMRSQGHWVALAAEPRSAIAQQAWKAGLRFYPLRTHKSVLPFEIIRMAFWLLVNRVKIVNTHSSNDAWLAGIAARLTGCVLIRSRHIEVDYPNRFMSGLAFRVLPRHVLTTSQRIADRLGRELEVPPERVTCISTGVDLIRFHPDVKPTLRRELGLAPNVPLVGMVSVLRSWKGHSTFLEAIALLLQNTAEPIHFVIAGTGPGLTELQTKLAQEPWKDHVTLLGHRVDIPHILASLDVLVLPSYAHEGIPQIILQAQAAGRAVVATTIGGIPEVVEDNVTGLLIAPKDAPALAQKIQLLLNDPALRNRIGQAARAAVEANHGLDHMGQQLLGLYEILRSR